MDRDAYGRKRSPRSIPTGDGSRGGNWHDPEYRKAYFRQWRRTHPEYLVRDRQTRRDRARRIQLEKELNELDDVITMTDVLRDMVKDELTRMSGRVLGERLMIDHASISRFVNFKTRDLFGPTVDAMVAYFGIWTIARHWAKMKRRGRT